MAGLDKSEVTGSVLRSKGWDDTKQRMSFSATLSFSFSGGVLDAQVVFEKMGEKSGRKAKTLKFKSGKLTPEGVALHLMDYVYG